MVILYRHFIHTLRGYFPLLGMAEVSRMDPVLGKQFLYFILTGPVLRHAVFLFSFMSHCLLCVDGMWLDLPMCFVEGYS